MNLKAADVILINSTVIIGLLLLFTFQSFSGSFNDKLISDFYSKNWDLDMESMAVEKFLEKCENFEPDYADDDFISKFQSKCADYKIKSLELETQIEYIHERGILLGFFHQNGTATEYIGFIQSAAAVWSIFNMIMIFPFVVSAIIESIYSLKKNEDDVSASKIGVIVMIIAFITLVAGLAIFISIFSYGTFGEIPE